MNKLLHLPLKSQWYLMIEDMNKIKQPKPNDF